MKLGRLDIVIAAIMAIVEEYSKGKKKMKNEKL